MGLIDGAADGDEQVQPLVQGCAVCQLLGVQRLPAM
jgi:hypothetical protein